jgi:subtilisin family serine protease
VAIDAVLSHCWSSGIIAAAGNRGSTEYFYPAAYRAVVSVAAIDSRQRAAYFSQRNDRVDLAAPGVSVYSTLPVKQGTYV